MPCSRLAIAALVLILPTACARRTGATDSPDAGGGAASSSEPALRLSTTPPEPKAKDKDDKPKWNVEEPTGPSKKVAIDTDEGTWMSLDVTPDGNTIVFDLLGDLYTMPIAGGEAKPLTEGIAWDMQPRVSPDGKLVAFTSDRDGADTI